MGFKFADEYYEFQIKLLIDHIRSIEARVGRIDGTLVAKANEMAPRLATISVVSLRLVADLLAKIGDVGRFKNASALVKYAGLNQTLRESGMSVRGESHISKEGSPYLRNSLYMVAVQQMRQDNFLNDFYRRKRAEGKCNCAALTAVARKLLLIIYSMLLTGEEFDPGRNRGR